MICFGNILEDYLEFYNITQTDFAARLGISQKHMNEIIKGNTKISHDLMIAISLLTDIDVNFIFSVERKRDLYESLMKKFGSEKEITKFLNTFHIKEMEERKWLVLRDDRSVAQNALDLLSFMKVKDFDIYQNYYDKKIMYKKLDNADQNKIYLWIRRCDNLIADKEVVKYDSSKLNLLFDELKRESLKPFNQESIIQILAKYGIILCVEDALKGTKIRGCSMVKNQTPVIYVTKYFKEKASFYFVLFHELGHIKTNYNKLINKIHVEDSEEDDMDKFALDKMIDDSIWSKIVDDYKNEIKDFSKYEISLSFICSRLAYEGIIKYSSKLYRENIERIG